MTGPPGLIRPAAEWVEDEKLAEQWLQDPAAVVRMIQVQAVHAVVEYYAPRAAAAHDRCAAAAVRELVAEQLVP